MPTEKETIIRERDAFCHGVTHGHELSVRCGRDAQRNELYSFDVSTRSALLRILDVRPLAAVAYPLPKITRLRIRKFSPGGNDLCVVDGALMERRRPFDHWRPAFGWVLSAEFIAFAADLFANPTEDVDDDGLALALGSREAEETTNGNR